MLTLRCDGNYLSSIFVLAFPQQNIIKNSTYFEVEMEFTVRKKDNFPVMHVVYMHNSKIILFFL